jgi:hypothetical protein
MAKKGKGHPLRNNVRDHPVFDHGDFILEAELAPLHAGDLKLVGQGLFHQHRNGEVQIAMLVAQMGEPGLPFLRLGIGHRGAFSFRRSLSPFAASDAFHARQDMSFVINSPCLSPQGDMRMDTSHITALETKHAGLDRLIQEERTRPAPDEILIAQWKKQKLKIKEALQLH